VAFQRRRQVEVKAGTIVCLPFAETENGGLLGRVNHHDRGGKPGQNANADNDHDPKRTGAAACAAAATTACATATFAPAAATIAALAKALLHAAHLLFKVWLIFFLAGILFARPVPGRASLPAAITVA
jgi:hypothetical protein